ncbi:hypothetical protein ACGFIP_12305 [Micromonospora zamorensis]|uniref:hypothetical protein n=1 Tax=Micromonospora zamorensis TaxID=709883 RepID=UPI0037207513
MITEPGSIVAAEVMLLNAVGSSTTQVSLFTSIGLALITAAVGFATSLLVERRKARREPRRQLTWSAAYERGLVRVSDDMRAKVRISYNDAEVSNLMSMVLTIANTGNRVVKNNYIRVSFSPTSAKVLEAVLDPAPEREVGVSAVDEDSHPYESRFIIGHLERTQSVSYRFLIADVSPQASPFSVHSFNDEGDVDFVQRDAARVRSDAEHLRPFLQAATLLAATFLIPVSGLSTIVARLILGAMFTGILLWHTPPVTRLAVQVLSGLSNAKFARMIFDGGNVRVSGDLVGGSKYIAHSAD